MPRQDYWTHTFDRRGALRGGAIGGVGLAAAALIGCSSAAPKPATPAGGAPAAASQPSTPQPTVSESLVYVQTRDAASLDPLDSQVYTVPERIGLVYPKLLYAQREEKADLSDAKWVPSYITQGWEFSGDGTKLTFRLKKGIKYQNIAPLSGREFVAADVKYSIDRYMTDPKSAFTARFSDITAIDTPDNYTVVFSLKKPSRYILYALAAEPSLITPPEIAKADSNFKNRAIGPGPFILDKVIQGEGATFKKNPDFVDAAKIYYNQFLIKVITDASTRNAAMKTSQSDYQTIASFTKTDLVSVESPNVKTYPFPSTGNSGYWFNMRNPKWADIRARTAISKSIDRQAIIDQVFLSSGVFTGPVPTGFGKWAWSDKELREFNALKYDPAEAKKLWDAAGKPSTLNKTYIPPKAIVPAYTVMAELMGEQLQKNLGIKSEYGTDEYATFVANVYNNKFDDVGVFGMSLFDGLDYVLAQYYPGGARNGPGLNDPKVNAMLDEVRGTLDDGAAQEKLKAVSKHLLDNVLSMAHLPTGNNYNAHNAKLQNFLPGVYPPGIEWALQSWKAK